MYLLLNIKVVNFYYHYINKSKSVFKSVSSIGIISANGSIPIYYIPIYYIPIYKLFLFDDLNIKNPIPPNTTKPPNIAITIIIIIILFPIAVNTPPIFFPNFPKKSNFSTPASILVYIPISACIS